MNDYGEGAHPIVMQRLLETNMEHTCGYGLDDYSLRAADVIRLAATLGVDAFIVQDIGMVQLCGMLRSVY